MPKKPRVKIPTRFDQLIIAFDSVIPNLEEGLLPQTSDGADSDHAYLRGLFQDADAAGYRLDAQNAHDAALAAREASENHYADRNANLEKVTVRMRALRDYFFAIEADNLNEIGKYGFTVVQRRSRGAIKPEVVIPEDYAGLVSSARRVVAACSSLFSAVPADANYDAFVDSIVHSGGFGGDAFLMAEFITEADDAHRQGRMKSEEAQRETAKRNKYAKSMTSLLRKARDFAFSVTYDDFNRVSEIGFEVIQTVPGTGGKTEEELASAYTNIEQSACNDSGTVNTACVAQTFGNPSDEYDLILEVSDPPGETVSILDVAVAAGQLDPTPAQDQPITS